MTIVKSDVALEERIKVTEPKRWKVVLINDDTTPVDFVITLLIELFKHTIDDAKNITIQVHEQGSGVAGVYSFEIAEAKAIEATALARTSGHQLQIKLSEE